MLRLALANPGAHLRLRVSGRVRDGSAAPPRRWPNGCARRSPGAARARCTRPTARKAAAACARSWPVPTNRRTPPATRSCSSAAASCATATCCTRSALGYGPLLEKGRYPMAALFLDVPGADVDVNVHPQKLEVRFARAQEVYAAVRHVVGAAIARAPWLRTADDRPMRTFTQPPRMEIAGAAGARPVRDGRGRAGAAARGAERAAAARARRWTTTSAGARRPRCDAAPAPARRRASSPASTTSARCTAPTWCARRRTS